MTEPIIMPDWEDRIRKFLDALSDEYRFYAPFACRPDMLSALAELVRLRKVRDAAQELADSIQGVCNVARAELAMPNARTWPHTIIFGQTVAKWDRIFAALAACERKEPKP